MIALEVVAVRDLEAAIDYYARAFGATVDHREIVESDGVEEALLRVADGLPVTPALPAPGLTLSDKRQVTAQLLKSGASISEIREKLKIADERDDDDDATGVRARPDRPARDGLLVRPLPHPLVDLQGHADQDRRRCAGA